MQKNILTLVSMIVAIIATWVLFYPRLGNKTPPSDVGNLYLVADILAQYKVDHNGRLPSKLSELVPSCVGYTNIEVFFWPPRSWDVTNLTIERLSQEIDDHGSFVYLGERGLKENLILYERPNLWLKHANAIIVTTNFEVEPLSIRDIQLRLSHLQMN